MLLKTPSWWLRTSINYARLEPQTLEDMKNEAIAADAHNVGVMAKVKEAKETLSKFVKANSNFDRASQRKVSDAVAKIVNIGSNLHVSWVTVLENRVKRDKSYIEEENKKREKAEEETRVKLEKTRKEVKAVEYLITHGWSVEDGYWHKGPVSTNEDSITVANSVARDLEVIRMEEAGVEVSCDCQECGTWTVGEHRCDCGNRRIEVDWSGDFETGILIWGAGY